jgi:hypothetical protein
VIIEQDEDEEDSEDSKPGTLDLGTSTVEARPSMLFRGFHFCVTSLPPETSKCLRMAIGNASMLSSAQALFLHVTCAPKSKRSKPSKATTILLSNGPARTIKYLVALSLGVPCVHVDWATGSIAAGRLLDYRGHLLDAGLDVLTRERISLPEGDEMAPAYPLDGIRIEVLARREEWELVVRAAGGKPVQRIGTADEARIDYALLPSGSGETPAISSLLRRLAKLGLVVVRSDWLIQCILTRKFIDPSSNPAVFVVLPLTNGSR